MALTPALRAPAPLLPMLGQQARAEFLMLIRAPAFSIVMLVFPLMFFALFGLPYAGKFSDGVSIGRFLFASFGAYAVMSVALFSFGVVVAGERAERRTVLMRASPLKPLAYFGGKLIASLAFAAITLGLLFVFANMTTHLPMTPMDLLRIESRLLLGVFPFITLGFAVGYLAGPNSAIGILNLINLPMAFASGLFMPLGSLPQFAQVISPYLPAYHFAQLGWDAVNAAAEPVWRSVLWLSGYTLLFGIIALRAYRREELKTFG
ncbi:MAG: ABC transporter permease [Candidatus Eremiobacteraeota bacterium]|nr:ABC transporter permease [Candidatus Eremiobacteraeota bacterium]